MTPTIRRTAAGFAATAVAFGPARMGFGLFLPAFREEFALSTSTAGMIASGGFLAFLLALLASAWLGRRHGERLQGRDVTRAAFPALNATLPGLAISATDLARGTIEAALGDGEGGILRTRDLTRLAAPGRPDPAPTDPASAGPP